jgi:hypothetical protein
MEFKFCFWLRHVFQVGVFSLSHRSDRTVAFTAGLYSLPLQQSTLGNVSGQSAVDKYPSRSPATGAKYKIEPRAKASARRTCPFTCTRPSLGENSAWVSAMDGHRRSSPFMGNGSVSAGPLPRARVPLHVGPTTQPHAALQVGMHGEREEETLTLAARIDAAKVTEMETHQHRSGRHVQELCVCMHSRMSLATTHEFRHAPLLDCFHIYAWWIGDGASGLATPPSNVWLIKLVNLYYYQVKCDGSSKSH